MPRTRANGRPAGTATHADRLAAIALGAAALAALAGATAPAPARAQDLPPFKLGLNTQFVANAFEISPKSNTGDVLKYRPAQSDYVGVILGYRWLAGTISFAVPASPEIRNIEGTSDYHDYRLAYYLRHFGVEASYNSYRSYLIDNSSVLSASALNGQTYYKLPDLWAVGYGLSAIYVPNPGDYLLPAAIDQSDIQEKSGGAWLLMATYRYQSIVNPGPMIPVEKQPEFGSESAIQAIHGENYAVGGGYGYNWVPGALFVAPFLAATLGYNGMSYDLPGTTILHGVAQVNLHARLALGISSRRFFMTADFYDDMYGMETDTLHVNDNVQGVTIALGARL